MRKNVKIQDGGIEKDDLIAIVCLNYSLKKIFF